MNSSIRLILNSLVLGLCCLGAIPGSAATLEVAAVDGQGVPTYFAGRSAELSKSADLEGAALEFLGRFLERELRGTGEEVLEVRQISSDELGHIRIRTRQLLHGRPVVGAEMLLHLDGESRQVLAVTGRVAKAEGAPLEPHLQAPEALDGALAAAGILQPETLEEPALTYILDPETREARLAWAALVRYEADNGPAEDRVFADAVTGGFITRHPQIFHVLDRRVFDANNGSGLPGTLVISEGGSSSDPEAQTVYTWMGVVTAYYALVFGRDSYDDAGGREISTVHYRSGYNNAFWSSSRSQMVYGDGDGSLFSPLGNALDVVGHEFTHGVTRAESNLVYMNESGALNESLSDVFAALIDGHWKGVNSDTWKVGEDIYTPGTSGDALRYMNNPTLDGSSRDYYADRYLGAADNGGVHWNSGIGNLAFYLLSQGGRHPRNRSVNLVAGIGIHKAGQIFYRASLNLVSSSGFDDMRAASVQAAEDLYGAGSNEAKRTQRAWCTVGVGGTTCPIELRGSGATFAGQRMAFLNWKFSPGSQVDVFKNGVKVLTTPNDGGQTHFFPFWGTPPTANYWVCEAGSTSSYNSDTCSNVVTIVFGTF